MIDNPTATVGSSITNLVKTIVGAGLFAIPFAFKNDGVAVGLLLIFLAAVTSSFGLILLAKCSKTLINPRNSSFFTICMLTYPSLAPLFDLAMVIQCFGVGLSYLVLVGDFFPDLFGGERKYWILLSAILVVPLCCLKKLDNLKYSSIVGVIALLYLSLLIGFRYLTDVAFAPEISFERGEISWFKVYDYKGLLSTFSIIIFAYVGAMNIFTIVNELQDNSMTNVRKVVDSSILISTILFLFVGLFGYLTFGSLTMGNILLNYDSDSLAIGIGKFCLAMMLILTFPLLFHPLRTAINNIVVWFIIKFEKSSLTPEISARDSEASNYVTAETHTSRPINLIINDDEVNDCEELNEDLLDSNNVIYQEHGHEEEPPKGGLNGVEHDVPFPETRFYIITALLLVSMYAMALNVKSFALVLSLVGATGSTSISFILPGLFGYKLIGTDALAIGHTMTKEDRLYRRLSLLLIHFGFAVMFLSLYVTLKYQQ